MRGWKLPIALVFVSIATSAFPAHAADLIWEVESPFRFFKQTSSYTMYEHAFEAARGNAGTPLPVDVIWRTERRLNDPDCKNPTTPTTCAETRRARYDQQRLGWAARTIGEVCYESNGNPRRYPTQCVRKYSWGSAKEDYVLPEAHTVIVGLSPARLAQAGAGQCVWVWRPRFDAGKMEVRKQPCRDKLTIARVPFSLNRADSGVSVLVKLPDGSELSDNNVVVEDLLIVALGDSFASGESNPDRPVTFSASREMLYDPTMARDDMATRSMKPGENNFNTASEQQADPKVLPRRLLEDEQKDLIYKLSSPEFAKAFDKAGAHWLSADCHRSQYGYPFRVGLELTLENRHRAVTLMSFACSGAEVTEGLFLPMRAREGKPALVRPEFDQLSDLLCRGGAPARTTSVNYTLPMFATGSTAIAMQTVTQRWCPPAQRKRAIDLVLLSIGGNDVGFGGLAAYSMTESAADLAPVAALVGEQIRFPPAVARAYLGVLDRRLQAVKQALHDGFGVEPARVVQSSYEPIQFDETGALCGSMPTLGMDVHPKLKLSRARVAETASFLHDFQARLECIVNVGRHADCPKGLATGSGTGFSLVTEHLAKFAKRGICARDPKRAIADGVMMGMPRKSAVTDDWEPYSPADELPYAHRWRLFRTPNDAFLTANTHLAGILPFDIMQPAYAGLYSGAVHPSAEGHAMVADSVMLHVRPIVDRHLSIKIKPVAETRPQ
jgi:lysophospholipase L1-like esterase